MKIIDKIELPQESNKQIKSREKAKNKSKQKEAIIGLTNKINKFNNA